jgi:hypothetical protein
MRSSTSNNDGGTSSRIVRRVPLLFILYNMTNCHSSLGFSSRHLVPRNNNNHQLSFQQYHHYFGVSRLFLQSTSNENNSTDTSVERRGPQQPSLLEIVDDKIEDPSLIVVDLFAIAIACQLLGLLDAVNDPVWIAKGGWAQPLEAPKTLGVLVQRFSTISVSWISVGLLLNGYQTSPSSSSPAESQVSFFQHLFRIWACFVVVMLAVDVGFSEILFQRGEFHLTQIARQSYFVGLTIPAFRFLDGQYFR